MKRLFLSIVMLALVGAAFAQTPEEKAALKAAQKEANSLLSKGTGLRDNINTLYNAIQEETAKGEKAKQQVIDNNNATIQENAKEANAVLMEAIKTGVLDEKKMYEACKALDEVSAHLLNPQLEKAAAHESFDTLLFAKAVDGVCTGCYGVIEHANRKDGTQKATAEVDELKMPKLMVYYAYLCLFYTETQNLKGAAEAFDKYANFAKDYPLVADDDAVKNPQYPIGQFAFNLYYTAFELKDVANCEKYYPLALTYEDEGSHNFVISSRPQLYRELNDTVKWKEALEVVVRDYPESEAAGTALQNLLSLASVEGPAEMERVATELLNEHPTSKVANYGMGYSLFSQEKYEEAAEYFQKALDLDSEYEEAAMMAGMSYYRKALNNFYEYIDNKSFKSTADMEAAEDQYVKSYFRKAKDYFEKCKELEPERVDDWAGPLQNIYKNLGEEEKVAEMSALIN